MERMKMSEWIKKIDEIWQEFSPTYLAKFMESMPKRLEECIASNGRTIRL
jgi:hypothetical protein